MPEAAFTARGRGEFAGFDPRDARHARQHELRDAHAAFDHERLGAQVLHDDPHLAAIIRVDRGRAVGQRDAVLGGKPRARTDLHLEACRDFHGEARGDQRDRKLPRQVDRLKLDSRGGRVVVSTCHSLSDWQERRRHPVRLLTRAALHRCHTVLAVSEAVRRAITRHDAALRVRTDVLRNGTDLSAFAAVLGMRAAAREFLGYRHGSFVVGAVARLEPRKGLDVLLSAASEALARVPGLEVLSVGDGSERARLMAQSNELGLSSRVRFVGEQKDVRPYLAALDLFVAPSRSEGLGIAPVEAFASGVPVAGAAVGGIAEVLANGGVGWLLPSEVTAWANAIVHAARTPDELERMSEAGLERTCDRLAAIYERALGQAAHRGLEAA